MLKRALIPLSLLVIAVILSGCTALTGGGGAVAGTNGIIIKDFGFDYSPIYSGESTGLALELQNVGGVKGTLKEIEIFGVDYGATPGALTWGEGSGDSFKSGVMDDELLPPDPTSGFEGDEYFVEYIPESPIDIKSPTTYDFQVRAKYLYSTTFTGKITIVRDDYLRSLPADQRESLIKVGGVQDATVTGGPLSLAAASGSHFIIRSDDIVTARPIRFKITNIGSGFPYLKDGYSNENLHRVTVTAAEGIECYVGTDDAEIKLSRGKTGVISCDFTPDAYNDITNKVDKMFSVKLEYGYYVDSSASITINPVLEY